jgi:hypothetical protein
MVALCVTRDNVTRDSDCTISFGTFQRKEIIADSKEEIHDITSNNRPQTPAVVQLLEQYPSI